MDNYCIIFYIFQAILYHFISPSAHKGNNIQNWFLTRISLESTCSIGKSGGYVYRKKHMFCYLDRFVFINIVNWQRDCILLICLINTISLLHMRIEYIYTYVYINIGMVNMNTHTSIAFNWLNKWGAESKFVCKIRWADGITKIGFTILNNAFIFECYAFLSLNVSQKWMCITCFPKENFWSFLALQVVLNSLTPNI